MKTFLLLLLFSFNALAQSTSAKLPSAPAASATTPANTTSVDIPGFSLQRLKEKFRINYFSETLGPTVKKWDDNEYTDEGRKDVVPMSMYHSFNVRYAMTQKFNLFMSPRFTTVIGDRNDIYDDMEQNNFYVDDWQFGFMYTFLRTQNFQYNQRLTHREPFSRKSRNEHLDSQIEWQHDMTYAVSPAFRIIHWNNYRLYAYDGQSSTERYRINFRTLFNYAINDKWNVQYVHELDLQHRNPHKSNNPKHRDMNFMKPYHDYSSFGVGYSPIRDLTFIPFVRLLDNGNIRNETTMVGLWVLGRVI